MRSLKGWTLAPTSTGATGHRDRPAARRRRVGRIAGAAITAILASTLVPGAVAPAYADVADGPVDAANGFPVFYDDGNVRLRLCTDGPGCLAVLPFPADPVSYPDNFPDEAFWYSAFASQGNLSGYEASLEATHSDLGVVIDGNQIGFGRLRFQVDNLEPLATYTITHPYGVNTFVAEEDQDPTVGFINETFDVGCADPAPGAPCDWNAVGAGFLGDFAAGQTATFVRQENAPAGTLGDINALPSAVTGAPSGVNAVIVSGPDAGGPGIDTLTVSDFNVQGEIVVPNAGTPSRPDLVVASDTGRSSTDNITNDTTPTFSGTVQGADAAAEVAVDLLVDDVVVQTDNTVNGIYSLTPPAPLSPTAHTVVASTSVATSASLSVTVDTVAPIVTLGSPRPSNNTADRTPTFTFTSDDLGATFECQLLPSVPTFAPCTSPMAFPAQIDDDYTFNVRATDVAGNASVPASFSWRIGAAVTRLSDFNRDGRTDLVARDSAGSLWLYPGNGTGTFLPRRLMATGWNVFTAIVTPGDVTGDGDADVLARNAAGALRLYPGNGRGGFLASRLIGASGWNAMTVITGAGLMSGDARPDVMARDSAGRLWLYPMVGNGTFQTRRLIGASGWNVMTAIMGPGDLSGDARADLLARDGAGRLWLYRGNNAGQFSARTSAGTGWQGMTALVTPGNWDRTGGNDLIARGASGTLYLYPGNNAGQLTARRVIGTGFSSYSFLG